MEGSLVGNASLGCWITIMFSGVMLMFEDFFRLFLCVAGLLIFVRQPCRFSLFKSFISLRIFRSTRTFEEPF